MTKPLVDEIKRISTELGQYVELGVIDYYLPSDPEGERYVVGTQGQILNMDPEQAICFLHGASAVAIRLVTKSGLKL